MHTKLYFWPVAGGLSVWVSFQTLFVAHFFQDRIAHLPPFWDNLAYQLIALQFSKDPAVYFHYAQSSLPWGWLGSLAIGYKMLGDSVWAPIAVTGFFSMLFLSSVYSVLRTLGCRFYFSLIFTLATSILPNYLYQNVLQTRNDYPAAALLAFSLVLFLKSFGSYHRRTAFWSGSLAGIATLVKLSLSGYILWPFFFYAVGLVPARQNLKRRATALLWFGVGFFVFGGWFYIYNFPSIVRYYSYWANMQAWIESQYGLTGLWEKYVFYPKNFMNFHLYPIGVYFLGIVFCVSIFTFFKKIVRSDFVVKSEFLAERVFIFIAWIFPALFLSWRGSLAQVGDIPWLPYLWGSLGVVLNFKIQTQVFSDLRFLKIASGLPILVIALLLGVSVKSIVLEGPAEPRDFQVFQKHLFNLKVQHNILLEPSMTVFSHPLYNVEASSWQWLMSGERHAPLQSCVYFMDVLPEEKPESIYRGFKNNIKMLVTSDQDLVPMGGESFHTFNRFRLELMELINMNEDFVKVDSLKLAEGKITLNFWVRRP